MEEPPATLDYAGHRRLLRRHGAPRMEWLPLEGLDESRLALAVERLPGPLCYPHVQGHLLRLPAACSGDIPWRVVPPRLDPDLLSSPANGPQPIGDFPPLPQNLPI